jgi:hypothetical protein
MRCGIAIMTGGTTPVRNVRRHVSVDDSRPWCIASLGLVRPPMRSSQNYNFVRPHQTLTKENGGKKTTPAMAAGVTNHVWTYRDIAALFD